MLAENQIAKYNLSLFEQLKTRFKDLRTLAKEKLSILEDKAIADLEAEGKISSETEENFCDIADIIGTVADKEANDKLLDARSDVLDAFHPDPPYDFAFDFAISYYLKRYRKALERAVAAHAGKWEIFLMEQSAKALKRRDEDLITLLNKLGKGAKRLKEVS
jgi:hypothetical protein